MDKEKWKPSSDVKMDCIDGVEIFELYGSIHITRTQREI